MPHALQIRNAPALAPDLETRTAVAALQTAWTEFRAANDARLAEIEKRGASDVVTAEKVDRVNAAITEMRAQMDELEKRAQRPGAPANDTGEDKPYREQFRQYLRRGVVGADLEQRSMAEASNPDGGYLTSPVMDTQVVSLLRDMSPVRSIVSQQSISGASYKRPISNADNASGWVGERDARGQTQNTTLGMIEITAHELYANIAVTQTLLDDTFLDLETWVAGETAAEFARREGDAFINGDGVNKPRGLLSLPTTVETGTSDAAQGRLGLVKTGVDGQFGNGTTLFEGDSLINLMARLRQEYRPNARWLMNRFTEAAIRKFKTVDAEYLWQPGLQAGAPPSLLGHSITIADHMPVIAEGAIPVLFGDFRRFYKIIDRIGMRTLRDPFSAKPYVLFYVTKRVGGGHEITQAVKGLQLKA